MCPAMVEYYTSAATTQPVVAAHPVIARLPNSARSAAMTAATVAHRVNPADSARSASQSIWIGRGAYRSRHSASVPGSGWYS